MTGEILQKHKMTLTERIEDKSKNDDKSKHDQNLSNVVEIYFTRQSKIIEDKVQPIQFILGV